MQREATDRFYTKTEAANILGVSVRQVTNYLQNGKLRRVYDRRNRVQIPAEDVRKLYDDRRSPAVPTRDEVEALQQRIVRLESTIEVLKLALGTGAPRRARTETELLLLRQQCLDAMSSGRWTTQLMTELADELMSLQDVDILLLCELRGVVAWTPLIDLARRMVRQIEHDPTYPGGGLDVIYQRLQRAEDRLLGLIQTCAAVPSKVPPPLAKDLRRELQLRPGHLESYIASYIVAQA